MTGWQAAQAKRRFGDLVDAATHNGPQMVLRRSDPVAVVMSANDYRILKNQADDAFARFLLASPLTEDDLDFGVGMSLSGEP